MLNTNPVTKLASHDRILKKIEVKCTKEGCDFGHILYAITAKVIFS